MTKVSQSILKAFAFIFFLSFFNLSVFPQEVSNQNQTQSESFQQESLQPSSETASNWKWDSGSSQEEVKGPSTIGLFFKMVFTLLIVLLLAYLALRLLKRGGKLSDSEDPFLRHVSHLSLSASRSVDVVTILDHAYILGVSDNAVNLIGQIDDQELVNSMNLYADKNDNTKRPRSFDDILSIFMPNASGKNGSSNVFSSSARKASESLRQQRQRLNEEE
ncbi:MAG: flagellar biosynthetic protein FliO [Treponema sp.]|nr:flagellar biosynthetic protein FliO [Treponema sp.]